MFIPIHRRLVWPVVLLGAVVALPVPAQTGSWRRGPIELVLTDSTYRATLAGQLGAGGRVVRRGDTLFVRDTEGSRRCQGDAEGRYVAAVRGDSLMLRAVDESCTGRRGAFSGGPFVRVEAGGVLVLEGAYLIDGTAAPVRANMSIVVRDGQIAEVFPSGSAPIPSSAQRIDLRGKWVIPGLIDAHVHLATEPSGADNRASVATRLRAELRGGVTTVRDMAGDARALADLARATRVGDLPGPDIYYSAVWAGRDFMSDNRVASSTRGTRPGAEPWMRTVGTDSDWRIAAAEARGSGATGIKLYADGTPAVARATVAAAHASGLRVWAHATLFPARPSDLVAAGVDVLSHAPLLAWDGVDSLPDYRARYAAPFDRVRPDSPPIVGLLERMAKAGTLFEPTLFVFGREGGNTQMKEWAVAVTRRAAAAGVPIVAGTDGMIGPGEDAVPNLHRELELLVGAGLTPIRALQAATSNAARALGIEQRTGSVRPGMLADLVVLGADPLADIRNTQKIEQVFKRGIAAR